MLGLTRSAALELARDRIRVIALCPGATDTPMLTEVIEGWEAASADQVQAIMEMVAPTAVLLLDAPDYLTGVPIPVDGAQTAR